MGTQCICPQRRQDEHEITNIKIKRKVSDKITDITASHSEIIINNQLLISQAKGTPLDKYIIEKPLGEGSFGKVFLVKHKETGIQRAMKEIVKDNKTLVSDVENEIEILKKLDHPNIVKIYEFFEKGDRFYLITEYCHYGELFDEINKIQKFTEEQTAVIMYQPQ